MIVTREQMWLDDMPENMVPLRSTGVYVVDGGRIHSITRFLDADQRDALMREAVVGDWRNPASTFHLRAGGTYDLVTGTRPSDSGRYTIEGGVLRVVSDEQTVHCQPGDAGPWRLSFTSDERFSAARIEDMCEGTRTSPTVDWRRVTE